MHFDFPLVLQPFTLSPDGVTKLQLFEDPRLQQEAEEIYAQRLHGFYDHDLVEQEVSLYHSLLI